MTRQLLHPRALPRITPSFFPHNVSVQESGSAVDADGQPTPVWTTVLGYSNLPCHIAPVSSVQERKLVERVVTDADTVILIAGDYRDVILTDRRLVAGDGTAYDVIGVERDSVGATTRVIARTAST